MCPGAPRRPTWPRRAQQEETVRNRPPAMIKAAVTVVNPLPDDP